jgi:uncharacterized protein (TIGR02246 family)
MMIGDAKEKEIRDLLMTLCNGWNKHDMKLFASVFSENADFVNVAGKLWKGRIEIESNHAKAHISQMKDSKLEIEKIEMKFVQPNLAIIHVDSSVTGDKNPDGTPRTGIRYALMRAVALNEKGYGWKLIAAHNTNKI